MGKTLREKCDREAIEEEGKYTVNLEREELQRIA